MWLIYVVLKDYYFEMASQQNTDISVVSWFAWTRDKLRNRNDGVAAPTTRKITLHHLTCQSIVDRRSQFICNSDRISGVPPFLAKHSVSLISQHKMIVFNWRFSYYNICCCISNAHKLYRFNDWLLPCHGIMCARRTQNWIEMLWCSCTLMKMREKNGWNWFLFVCPKAF